MEKILFFLQKIIDLLKPHPPLDVNALVSSSKTYTLDYKERKHAFLWCPVVTTLSFEQYGSGLVPAQIWVNLGMKEGVQITSTSSTDILLIFRFTDEEIP